MTHFNLNTFAFPSIYNENNTLLTLHLIKKQIQENLIREINVNFELKQRLNKQIQAKTAQQGLQQSQSAQDSLYNISSSFDSEETTRKRCTTTKSKKIKNETKNIPKNFGKAIINFVEQNQGLTERLLKVTGKDYSSFLKALKSKKKDLNSIAELRKLWLDNTFQYAKQMRALSLFFLKKISLKYIFGSRISHYEGHIKYRSRLIDVLKTPHLFTFIKC